MLICVKICLNLVIAKNYRKLVKQYANVYAKEPPYIEPIEVEANDSDETIAARIVESRRKAYHIGASVQSQLLL